ncbi:phosphatidate cytidylyltransferase [Ilumatobacter nonamiensis]|uniref:phosphatidate cytidylyltransferase n=1 Tax=Ilumatobacter nonamiensis TaxID=467093 RepID=UPI00034DB37D|nr:phosphatidate cytidylyltransferase [Ilumatobacter nonamiensis]
MSDDIWRGDDESDPSTGGRRPGRFEASMDEFDEEEFGGPLFGDDPGPAQPGPGVTGENTGLSFADDATGPLPHWSEPATGQIPKIDAVEAESDDSDDLDVWSTFTSDSPVWKEGDSVDEPSGTLTGAAPVPEAPVPDAVVPEDPTGELRWEDDALEPALPPEPAAVDEGLGATTTNDAVVADLPPREPPRITIGTDPSGMPRRPNPARRGSTPQRPPNSGATVGTSDNRNLPVAIGTGVALAAVFIALIRFVGPLGALLFVTVLLTIAGVEYFGKVTEKGYRPAVAPGVTAIAAAPLAAYWVGDQGIVMVVAFAFIAGALGFIGASSIESGPMPNMAITTLGVVWIGVLGAYAGMLLDFSNISTGFYEDGAPWGTDTLVILAIGVVANDVGAYFLGSAFGKTPLRAWISPAKSVEGFLGGTVLTMLAMVVIASQDFFDTWTQMSDLLFLGLVISILAPLGDLTESMFKRNLDVKDFGAIVTGHGGVLDRFDGFLFTLPGVYYLFLVLTPYAEFSPS